MPWNQPGSGNDRDPWGQGNGQSGPPDLDEVVQNIRKKFSGFGGSGGGSSSGGNGPSMPGKAGIGLILAGALAVWGFLGIYQVEQGEDAVILRFGKYLDTSTAGLHWVPYGIDKVTKINTQKISTVEVGYRENARTNQKSAVPREALMLTADENIIDIKFAVQYDIKSPVDLIFNVSEAWDSVIRSATESAVREVVGRNTMDYAITDGRAQIAAETRTLLQTILDRYQTGLNIRAVEMQDAQPPLEVKPAFDDAVRAREDKERLKNEAEAYSNDVIPRARGQASRIVEEAEGFKASVIAKAEGEASRFNQIYTEYSQAPGVTRDRLYLDTMENVFTNSTKLMIDQKDGGNSMIYLPIDQLLKNNSRSNGSSRLLPASGNQLNSTTDNGSDDGFRAGRTDRFNTLRDERG